jgi:hypothetical protein
MLLRGGRIVEKFEAMAQHGLVLSSETVAALGKANGYSDRFWRYVAGFGLVVIALLLWR